MEMKCGDKHKVKSEICNEKGAWNKTATSFGNEMDRAVDRIMKKHEGKLSVDAMMMIALQSMTLRGCYAKAISSLK